MFDIDTFDIAKYDTILAHGLSRGIGKRGEQVCIEAAICETLGLPHNDDPQCVAPSVRKFKINLNDSFNWPSPKERALGLRDLGIAQLGSLGVVNDKEFVARLAEKTIRVLIPKLFREIFPGNPKCLEAADKCEREGSNVAASATAATAASYASYASYAASAASDAATASATASYAAAAAAAASAASYAATAAASYAAYAATAAHSVSYLKLSASLALEVLRELNSPGVKLLDRAA